MSAVPGMGVMLNMLQGRSKEEVELATNAIDKTIKSIELKDDALIIRFTRHKPDIMLRDDGQSCCEHRYMTCDDDLSFYAGARLRSIELADAPSVEGEYGDHEVQFLRIITSKGTVVAQTHNEHNGYYGGFYIRVSEAS